VLQGAVQADVSRVVFASSAAVYGTPETVPTPEEASTQPLSPYGASKLQAEQLCRTIAEDQGIEAPQLRLFNIFGPRQSTENEAGVVSIFMDRARRGLPLIIFGDGYQTRDFIYIKDVIQAIMRVITLETVPSVPINIGTGIPVSVRELAEAVQQLIPSCSDEILFEPPRPGDIYHSVAQITRMQHLLHFTPTYSVFDGLRDYCRPESGSKE
jgi:UDP-glucose 4-epimerase